MFLDRVSQLGYLEHDPEANILMNFPLSVRKILVKEVTDFLISPSANPGLLSSRSHIIWVLETCGQGFRLPIEEADIIQNVIELYRQWILDPKKRPAPLEKEFQFFLQIMLKQFSLLFLFRSDVVAEAHAQLCSAVLNIYLSISRTLAKKLNDETWDTLLKLLIGVADSLFLSPRDPSVLGAKLCNQMLRVLFECWLSGQTQKPQMWSYLKDRVSKWTNISQTIVQWQVVSLALTTRLIRIMYGQAHGTDTVTLRLEGESILNLPVEYIYISWHRILTILDDLNAIPNPANHLKAFQGVENIVGEFLKVTNNLPETTLPPDGNTILHIFGKWLFEGIQLNRSGFEEGTALAIKIVSGIFTERPNTIFLDTYLASYYRSLQEILMHEGRPLVSALLHSKYLLTQGMNGARILVQYYIYAITRVVVGNATCEPPYTVKNVRLASYSILGTIYSFPKYFGDSAFKLKLTYKERQIALANYHTGNLSSSNAPPAKSIFETKTYEELRPHLDYVLLEALKNETNIGNTLYLLQLCFAHCCLYIDEDSDFTRNIIHTIVGKVVSKKWSLGVVYAALRTLSRMAFLFPQISKGKELARKIINPLCGFVVSCCQELFRPRDENDKPMVRLTVQGFITIADWVLVDQWIVEPDMQMDRMNVVLDAIAMGICGPKVKQPEITATPEVKKSKKDKKDKKGEKKNESVEEVPVVMTSKKIVRAAKFLLRCLLNRFGVFPSPFVGAASVSSLVTEDELLSDIATKADKLGYPISDRKQYLRCYIMQDQTLISVVDQPYEIGGPRCTIILRDETGRYCWQCDPVFLPFNERGVESKTVEHCRQPVKTVRKPHHSGAAPLEDKSLQMITRYLKDKKWSYDPFDLSNAMVKDEESALNRSSYNLDRDIHVMPPPTADAYVPNSKFQQGRLLMTQLGFLTFKNWGRIYPLEQSANYFSQMKLLDQQPERDCLSVSVLFIDKKKTAVEALGSAHGSLDYQEFVSSLGWGIHIPSHTGYLGGLERSPPIHGETTLYYANYSTELIYHVATLMPNNSQQPDQPHKTRLLTNDLVLVVWTENPIDEYEPDFGKNNRMHLVIQPIFHRTTCNLYRIRLFLKQKLNGAKYWGAEYQETFGPLMDGMIVSKDRLGTLARETVIEMSLLLNDSINPKSLSPFDTRRRMIYDIGRKFRVIESLENFHTNLFAALPAKYIPPSRSPVPTCAERKASYIPVASSSSPLPLEAQSSNTLAVRKGRKKKSYTESDQSIEDVSVGSDSEKRSRRKLGKGRKPPTNSDLDSTPSAPSPSFSFPSAPPPMPHSPAPEQTWSSRIAKESASAPSKEMGGKIAMSSQRFVAEKEGSSFDESSPPPYGISKPPRPPRGHTLPQITDFETEE